MLLIVVPLNTLAHIPNWAQTYGCKYAFLLSSLSIWVGWMGCDTTSISSKKKNKTTATKKLSKYLFTLLLIPPTFYNWLTITYPHFKTEDSENSKIFHYSLGGKPALKWLRVINSLNLSFIVNICMFYSGDFNVLIGTQISLSVLCSILCIHHITFQEMSKNFLKPKNKNVSFSKSQGL